MSDSFHWPDFLPGFSRAAETAGFTRHTLVDTPDGPLCAWTRHGNGRHIYLSAGIHGDEPAGPAALLELMRDGFFQPDTCWTICPALNPGGLARGTREAPDGTDLNRDYWRQSTPVVRAHARWLRTLPVPALFLSLHEDWETQGFYFYEINLGPDQPARANAILDRVNPVFPPEASDDIDNHQPRHPGWIYHQAEADMPENWPEAIFLSKLGCPLSFTFETPSSAPLESRVAAHIAAVSAALESVA